MPADLTDAYTGCPDRAILAGFHAGRLADPDLDRVAGHLSTCDECATLLDSFDRDAPGPLTDRLIRCLATPEPSAELGYLALAEAAKDFWREEAQFDLSTVTRAGPPTEPTPAASVAGARVGPYLVRRVLGQGGMGVVYEAEHVGIKQVVALKMILAGEHARPEAVERFRREAEAAARLDHPNIVRLLHFGDHNGLPYFAMEYVPGTNLADRLKHAGRLAPRPAAELVRTLAGAVGYAHTRGVVHRDLKPANILLSSAADRPWTRPDGTAEPDGSSVELILHARQPLDAPKITDFGLAKLLDAAPDGVTVTNVVLGTPSYMAPEQADGRGAEVGPWTDVYALGAVLYTALTGRPPFSGADKYATIREVRRAELVPPSRLTKGLPRELEAICLKCLARVPAHRYDGGDALAADLKRWLDGTRTVARPPVWVRRHLRRLARVAVATGVLLGVVGGVLAAVRAAPVPARLGPAVATADQIRVQLLQQLVDGKAVTLVGNPGAVICDQESVRFGVQRTRVAPRPDGSVEVHSWGGMPSLVELMPAVPCDRFRLRAEVLHVEGLKASQTEVGVYVAERAFPDGADQGRVFTRLGYTDFWKPALLAEHTPPPKFQQKFQRNLAAGRFDVPSVVVFNTNSFMKYNASDWGGDSSDGPPDRATYEPTLRTGSGSLWRTLTLVVAPAGVTAAFNDLPSGAIPATTVGEFVRRRQVAMLSHDPADVRPGLMDPTFAPRGGIGLLVWRGSARFRRVVVEPLTTP